MKNIFVKISLLLVVLSLSACFELDKVDPNRQNEDSFWQTEDQLLMGVYACYDGLQSYYNSTAHVYYTGLSDEGTNEFPYEFNDLVRFKGDDLNQFIDVWVPMYNVIGRAYQVIERASDISGPNVVAITAEGRFFVAFGYYHLQLVFGDHVSFVDGIQSPADRPRRAEAGELYEIMERELELAIPDLPKASEYSSSNYGRVTKGAAQAMLAKVFLQQHKYAEAEEMLKNVVESNEYFLIENFEDNFVNLASINPESVFSTMFVSRGTEGPDANDWNLRSKFYSMKESNGAYGDIQATNFILESFQKEDDIDGNPDPRLDVSVFHENSEKLYYGEDWDFWYDGVPNPEITTGFYKYSEQAEAEANDGILGDQMGGTNFIVIRYADVLLMYAEALNENGSTGNAYTYVDEVRERSNMTPLSSAMPGLDKSAFLVQLMHERLVELSGELVRFDDLKRWGLYNTSNTNDPNFETFTEGKNEVAPIPQEELDLNPNLIQNPNY